MRIYVLVTGCDPLRVWLFKDGLVRFATEKYEAVSRTNKKDAFKHLTNYAINKNHPDFIRNDNLNTGHCSSENIDSHKRSVKSFFKQLEDLGNNMSVVWSKIKLIIAKTMIAIQPQLKLHSSCQADDPFNQGCFELLGFDVMLTKKMEPILLEVNHNPSLFADSEVDKNVKIDLVRNIFLMLDVSIKRKKRLMTYQQRIKKERIYQGKKSKSMRSKLKEKCISVRDFKLNKLKGSFEKVFPFPDKDEQKELNSLLDGSVYLNSSYSQNGVSWKYNKPSKIQFKDIKKSQKKSAYQNLFGSKFSQFSENCQEEKSTDASKSKVKNSILSFNQPISPYNQMVERRLPKINKNSKIKKIKSMPRGIRYEAKLSSLFKAYDSIQQKHKLEVPPLPIDGSNKKFKINTETKYRQNLTTRKRNY